METKLLIAYCSVSNGNTRRIAEQMQKATGADLVTAEAEIEAWIDQVKS